MALMANVGSYNIKHEIDFGIRQYLSIYVVVRANLSRFDHDLLKMQPF